MQWEGYVVLGLGIYFLHIVSQDHKQQEAKIKFLWERYLLLRLHLEYITKQQGLTYDSRIDFDKLPFYTSKFKRMRSSMEHLWGKLAPEIIDRLYHLDSIRSKQEKTVVNEMVIHIQHTNGVQEIIDSPTLAQLYKQKDNLLIDGLDVLQSIQEQFEEEQKAFQTY